MGARSGLKKAHGDLRKNPHSTDQITLYLPPSQAHLLAVPCKGTETLSVQGDSPSKTFTVLTIPRGLPARIPNSPFQSHLGSICMHARQPLLLLFSDRVHQQLHHHPVYAALHQLSPQRGVLKRSQAPIPWPGFQCEAFWRVFQAVSLQGGKTLS